jgi:glycosyltransferase involved in cell wall biosynthesis
LEPNKTFKLRVTGDTAGTNIEYLKSFCPQIEFLGFVKDVKPIISKSRISIAPIFIGGGTRLKIIEALALGTPVVSTSKGAQGLYVTHEKDILIADTPKDFAYQITRLLSDEQLWLNLSENGRQLVANQYDAGLLEKEFRQILNLLNFCV